MPCWTPTTINIMPTTMPTTTPTTTPTTISQHHRPFIVNVLSYLLSTWGFLISVVAVCLQELFPELRPAPPKFLTPTSKKSHRRSHRRSAPASLPSPFPLQEPASPTAARFSDPSSEFEAELQLHMTSVRQVPLGPESSRLAHVVTTAHQRLPFPCQTRRSTSPASNAPSSPRSSLSTACTSAASSFDGVSDTQSGFVTAEPESANTSPACRPERRRLSSSMRIPTMKSVFRGRRGTSVDVLEEDSASDFSAASENNSRKNSLLSENKPAFTNPWTDDIRCESPSPAPPLKRPSLSKSFTRRFSYLKTRSPSLSRVPVPRTQPYGPPYYAAMPGCEDDESSCSEQNKSDRVLSSVIKPHHRRSMTLAI